MSCFTPEMEHNETSQSGPDHAVDRSTGSQSREALIARRTPVPRQFPDLPTEIRDAIYRIVCQDIVADTNIHGCLHPRDTSLIQYTIVIHDYTRSRSFAPLGINQQMHDAFSKTMFAAHPRLASDGPWGMACIFSRIRLNEDPELEYMCVTASFVHLEPDDIKIEFTFIEVEHTKITFETQQQIVNVLTRSFNAEDKFTTLDFLMAVDRVLSLDVTLDLEAYHQYLEETPEEDQYFNDRASCIRCDIRLKREVDGGHGKVTMTPRRLYNT